MRSGRSDVSRAGRDDSRLPSSGVARSKICSARFVRISRRIATRPGTSVLDYCRRSANPVGRLVLRIAGLRRPRLDRSSDALCTALQLTNFWQDLDRDWQQGRLYVPLEDVEACARARQDLDDRRMTEPWQRALQRRRRAHARAVRRRARTCATACGGRLRYELRLTWLGGMRDPRSARARRLRRVRVQADAGRRADVPSAAAGERRMTRWSGRSHERPRDQLLLLVPRAARRQAAAPSSRSGISAGRSTMRWTSRSDRRAGVARWRNGASELARAVRGRRARDAAGPAAAARSSRAFKLPRSAFEDLIDGVAMDLEQRALRTFEELRQYCLRVASAVGPDLRRDLRLPRSCRRATTRSTSASRCS